MGLIFHFSVACRLPVGVVGLCWGGCVGSGFVTVAGVLWDPGVSPGEQENKGVRGSRGRWREVEGATKTCRDDPQRAAGTTTGV